MFTLISKLTKLVPESHGIDKILKHLTLLEVLSLQFEVLSELENPICEC